MGQSHNQYYQTQPLGSPAPIIWYASLPDHVKRLYDHKANFSQQPIAMVILAEVVCEAFTVWALENCLKRKTWKIYGKCCRMKKEKYDACRISVMTMLMRFIQLYQAIQ